MSARLKSCVDQCSSYDELVQFIETNLHNNFLLDGTFDKNIKDMYNYASKKGNVNVLQWLSEYESFNHSRCISIEVAVRNGDFDMLQWFKMNNYTKWKENLYACTIASRYNRLEMLKWLVEMGCPLTIYTCELAAVDCPTISEQELLALFQWLKENNCPWNDNVVVMTAVRKGYTRILQWMYVDPIWYEWDYFEETQKLFLKLTTNCCPPYTFDNTLSAAIESNQYHSVMWLLGHYSFASVYTSHQPITSLKRFLDLKYYDITCYLVDALATKCESSSTKQWVTSIDTETKQLPLASDLLRLIKHYI